MTLTVAIRADASVTIGTGHVMRCVTLATALQVQGHQVSFICRELPGHLMGFLEARGFPVRRLSALPESIAPGLSAPQSLYAKWLGVPWQTDAAETLEGLGPTDWLILDHYALDAQWETAIHDRVNHLLVLDDLANRPHTCEVLLDQNFYPNAQTRYQGLLPPHCQPLLGPQYALLRPEFQVARTRLRPRSGEVHRILVCLGGSDPTHETAKVLAALARWPAPLAIDVVVGQSNPNRDSIAQMCQELPGCSYHCQIDYMADLMIQADLAIGAGGSTSWERCCLGLPTLVAITAENQQELTLALADWGAIVNLGWANELTPETYLQSMTQLDRPQLQAMSQRGLDLVDGLGCARVIQILTEF